MDFINWIKDFWAMILNGKLAEMTPLQFVLFIAVCIGAFFILKWLLTTIWKGLKAIGRGIRNGASAKRRCSHIQCKHCGRTLDKCVCAENKNRGYMSRLYHYHKEQKESKKNSD